MSYKARKCNPKYYGDGVLDCGNTIKGLDKLVLANLGGENKEKKDED